MIPSVTRALLFSAWALLAAAEARALQVVQAREGETLFVKVSAEEITRIAIEGGRVQSWHAPKGKLRIEAEPERGQIFLRVVERDKPVSLFLVADSGATYALTLQPVDMPSESVIIKEAMKRRTAPANAASDRIDQIKRLAIVALTGRLADDLEYSQPGEDVALWAGARFTLDQSWRSESMAVDHYRLTNLGREEMRLAEQEFFRPDVIAVGVDKHTLAPGEGTRVIVIRHRRDD